MSLLNWIFDIYQHTQIDKAKEEAREARREVEAIRSGGGQGVDSMRLERALGELALATKTLQRLMVEKGVVSQGEMVAKLRAVDREDGVEDGRAPI